MKSVAVLFVLAACAADVPEHPTYVDDVAPILMANCARCHGAPTTTAEGRNCLRVDRWDSAPDASALCPDDQPTNVDVAMRADVILGVHDGAQMILDAVSTGAMPADGPPLTDRQQEILQRWMADGTPKHAGNAPPTITFLTPPAGDTTIDQSYVVRYDVSDPDGDAVTWSLGWTSGAKTGTFTTGLTGGKGMVTIDTSTLASGTYTLVATLDDGTVKVMVSSTGTLTVPAGRNAAPTVVVTAPNGGEFFYMTQPVTVTWLGNDDGASLVGDVVALRGTTVVPIATGVAETPGQPASVSWDLSAVTPATNYRIQVTVKDTGGLTATDTSDADFVVSAPPAQVSFSSQVQPIFDANCTGSMCHDANQPQESLNLTKGTSYGQLVGIASKECASTQRVKAGSPDQSYLVWKLQGSGGCFTGSRMPKGTAALSSTDIQLIRDWIANGAPNN
jgi:hypothetical protein